MKIVGLITEYNPFHNGHKYHIEQALKETGSDMAVVVMSGDFVQRGTPAIMPKHLRTKAALMSGAAAVFELPVIYACSSAEYFATGAVSLLHSLGCVDSICFGGECTHIDLMKKIAHILVDEPEEYKILLQCFLKKGNSFPVSRKLAVEAYTGNPEYGKIMDTPNNILGIEYIKAGLRLNSRIEFHVLKRISSGYHDSELKGGLSSATSIRNLIESQNVFPSKLLYDQIPAEVCSLLSNNYNSMFPLTADDFSLLLHYKLLGENGNSLLSYADMSVELANRIMKNLNEFRNWTQFCNLLKTKEVTYSRISRCLLHVLLNIKTDDYKNIDPLRPVPYARMLGFSSPHKEILSVIKKSSTIPVITKIGSASFDSKALRLLLEKDLYTSNVYQTVLSHKFDQPFLHETQKQIIIV